MLQAARELESQDGIHCNLTLLFSFAQVGIMDILYCSGNAGKIISKPANYTQGWASVLSKRTFHSFRSFRSFRSFAFFYKERTVLCFFRSFAFFYKERSILSVLLRSL